jgi:isoprenylcysteine carboxyl methyltransferase (ICMT) family protein YpbQ
MDAPRSASSFAFNVIALSIGLFVAQLSQRLWPGDAERTLFYAGSGVALTIVLADVILHKVSWRAATGLTAHALQSVNLLDTTLRLLGLFLTLATIGIVYWLIPEYHGTFYDPYWHFLQTIAWPTLTLAPLYFLWVGRHLAVSNDPYLQLGRLLVGRDWGRINHESLRAHWLAWTVKAFFLPLMVVYLHDKVGTLNGAFRMLSWSTLNLYHFFYELSFFIDLLFCVLGYTLTLRVLDTHVRSTEPTVLGWVAALVCYQPFYSVFGNAYVKYDDSGIFWDTWLGTFPVLRAFWATAIIALVLMYALSTVAFGLRFSNLTHRGIITSGPYRFTKHPAYLSKNLSWWLISVPFVSHSGWLEAMRHCVLLVLLNSIYFLRARTEEWHLSRDPAYLAYSAWIREHGLFARFRFWSHKRTTMPASVPPTVSTSSEVIR